MCIINTLLYILHMFICAVDKPIQTVIQKPSESTTALNYRPSQQLRSCRDGNLTTLFLVRLRPKRVNQYLAQTRGGGGGGGGGGRGYSHIRTVQVCAARTPSPSPPPPCFGLVSKFSVGFKSLLKQGLSELEIHDGLVPRLL